MIASATASSTSEKPLLLLIAPGSWCNDHDPVIDRGGDSGPMLVDIVVWLGRARRPKSTSGGPDVEIFPNREIAVLALEVVLWICRRTNRSVQRPACEYQKGRVSPSANPKDYLE